LSELCNLSPGIAKRATLCGLCLSSNELSWDILLVLIGWFVFVFFLYLTYEWTAGLQKGGEFVIFDRFLLPGIFPVAIICALIITRFPYKVLIPVMVIAVAFGSALYVQWALNLNILPGWLTERTVASRWPGYIFPLGSISSPG